MENEAMLSLTKTKMDNLIKKIIYLDELTVKYNPKVDLMKDEVIAKLQWGIKDIRNFLSDYED